MRQEKNLGVCRFLDKYRFGTETAFIRPMHTHRLRINPGLLHVLNNRPLLSLAVAGAFFLSGCLSHEYVIPKPELERLVQIPPEQRAQSFTAVQGIGERRSPAIDPNAPPPTYSDPNSAQGYDPNYPPPQGYADPGVHVGVGVMISPFPAGPHHHGHVRPAPRVAPPAPRAAPIKSTPRAGTAPSKGKGSSDEFAVLMVILVVMASIGMVATEGMRWDGTLGTYPEQPIHLTDAAGVERIIPLAALTKEDVAASTRATVMDDEGYGLLRGTRRPLDRKGVAFKVDAGGIQSQSSRYSFGGMAADLQLGYFPHHRIGILASAAFAGGDDSRMEHFSRHTLSGEVQLFPLSIWRAHVGAFGHIGNQWASDSTGSRSGLALGAGLLFELALTTRLALTFRADYTHAKIAEGTQAWANTTMFTGGIAIY